MYLSRVELDLRNHETLRALNVPRRLHGAVEAAFEGPRTRRLWRLDRREGRLWLLILSEEVPELSGIVAQFGPPDGTAETRDYEPLLARVAEGTVWRFRLAANPIKNVKEADGRGTVRNHVTVAQQEQWLAERAPKHGFALEPDGFRVVDSRWISFDKATDGSPVRIHAVTFEGLLRVTDAGRFREALTHGIGRGKAYGLGLLTLMRVP